MVAVYTGSSVDGLTRVTQDDNDCPNEYGARVSFTATAGQEYRIAVDGAYGDWGDLTLRWSRTILAPVNHGTPTILGRPIDGAQLSATTGQWGGTPPLAFGYQWLRCTNSLPADHGSERCDVPAHELRRRVSTASAGDGVERGRFPDRRIGDDGHRRAIASGERDPTFDHGGSIPGRRPERGRRTVERHRALVHVSVAAVPKRDLHRHRRRGGVHGQPWRPGEQTGRDRDCDQRCRVGNRRFSAEPPRHAAPGLHRSAPQGKAARRSPPIDSRRALRDGAGTAGGLA